MSAITDTGLARINQARQLYGDAAAELVRAAAAGEKVGAVDSHPYQGGNSWRDAGRLSPPDWSSDDSADHFWTLVCWTGSDWSAVAIPRERLGELGLPDEA